MIHALLLPLAAALAPPATLDPSVTATEEVQALCLRAAEGDLSAEAECISVIREYADPMLVDEMDPNFQSSCMVVDKVAPSELVWIYLEWLEQHSDAGPKPASTTITAALFEKLPCGWQER